MSVEGAYVSVRDDVNMKYYGSEINPAKLFDGSVAPPVNAKVRVGCEFCPPTRLTTCRCSTRLPVGARLVSPRLASTVCATADPAASQSCVQPLYDKLNEYEQLYNIADTIYRNNPQDTPPPAASDEFADDVPTGDNGGDDGNGQGDQQGSEGPKVFSPDRRQAYQAAAAECEWDSKSKVAVLHSPVSLAVTLTFKPGTSCHFPDRNEHPEEQWGGLYEGGSGVAIGGEEDTADVSLQRYQGGSRWKCDESTTNSLVRVPHPRPSNYTH